MRGMKAPSRKNLRKFSRLTKVENGKAYYSDGTIEVLNKFSKLKKLKKEAGL